MAEQRIQIPGSDALEAVRADADGASGVAIIGAPHPLYGGSLDNPVVEALAAGFAASGISSLRFNYRGVGRSAGARSGDIARAAEDYACACAWTQAMPGSRRFAAGYSFGAVAAVEAAISGFGSTPLDALALVAPPGALLDRVRLGALALPIHLLVGDADTYLSVAAARELAASLPDCKLTVCEADHFFAYELAEVRRFAASAV